jgi:hypothetical protein
MSPKASMTQPAICQEVNVFGQFVKQIAEFTLPVLSAKIFDLQEQ